MPDKKQDIMTDDEAQEAQRRLAEYNQAQAEQRRSDLEKKFKPIVEVTSSKEWKKVYDGIVELRKTELRDEGEFDTFLRGLVQIMDGLVGELNRLSPPAATTGSLAAPVTVATPA